MFALRSGAGAVAVQPLDLVLLRVAEPAADPEAISTQQRPASEVEQLRYPGSDVREPSTTRWPASANAVAAVLSVHTLKGAA